MKIKRICMLLIVVGVFGGCWGGMPESVAVEIPATQVPQAAATRRVRTLPAMLTFKSLCEMPSDRDHCASFIDQPPPICDIIPGQTELAEALQRLGDEDQLFHFEGSWRSTEFPVGLLCDAQENIQWVAYQACELTLGEVVDVYGPPQSVFFNVMCESGQDPMIDCAYPPYDTVSFLWPEQGLFIESMFKDNLHTYDGQSLPFSPDFSIELVWYYPPFSFEEYEKSVLSSGDVFEWPGFAVEND